MISAENSRDTLKADLVSVAAMYEADRQTIENGTPGFTLMRAAGDGVVHHIMEQWPHGAITVLAGPGNNGGDGFVIAERLQMAGRTVRLGLLGNPKALKGDAATAYQRWRGLTQAATPDLLQDADIIVDALFGVGLDRPIEGDVANLIDAVNAKHARGVGVVAVDIPSGIHGDTGAVMGVAVKADLTVTFFRKKPGHVLMPGRLFAGDIKIVDIGIADAVLADIGGRLCENTPSLWAGVFPRPAPEDHKYSRGHAVVVSGSAHQTGAARLGAGAALRIGAGLVTVASPLDAVAVNAGHLTAVMVHPIADLAAFEAFIDDPRRNAILIGPGNGVGNDTKDRALAALCLKKRVVLDADALTAFADAPDILFDAISADTVLTPHDGEFGRIFPDVRADDGKIAMALTAARRSGAVILLKGPDTVVASPDGRASVTTNAPPTLATAGSGDVLAGLIAGLLAQGMPCFEAASAAAWVHGAAAVLCGPGLISEDISDKVNAVLRHLDEIWAQ